MNCLLFILALSLIFVVTLPMAFRILPRDRWQFCATLPIRRRADGHWEGLNLTWYGLLSANAYLFSVALLIVLMGALEVSLVSVLTATLILLGLTVPASSWVARWVEGKAHTFTVGGAVFVGTLSSPWILAALNRFPDWIDPVPILPMLAAIAICYAFGEGLGRLGCISFGCCYGKRLADCRPITQRFYRKWNFVFIGDTKKIAYADGMQGEQVVPIQAVTSILYLVIGLVGIALFCGRFYASAFLVTMVLSQAWRVYSETMRADYRGGQGISAYQIMGFVALPYCAMIAWIFPTNGALSPDIGIGLATLWNPAVLLFLQLLWAFIFVFMGRSAVSGATLDLHIHHDRV